HVDDLGRVGVGRHARHINAGGPQDGVVDVRTPATTVAQGTDRQHLGPMGHTGQRHAIVGDLRPGGTGHVGAVPGAGARRIVRVGTFADPRFLVGPVTQVPATGHAAVHEVARTITAARGHAV